MSTRQDLREVADHLRELIHTSPRTEGELNGWYSKSSSIYEHLLAAHPDVQLPHHVMHYLYDADIRVRPEYRASQDGAMREIIVALESGNVPEDPSVTISTGKRGLALIAGASLALVALITRACR